MTAPCGWRITTENDWHEAKKIDSLNLDMVKDIYAENKLNIKRLADRTYVDLSESFVDLSCFWAIGDTTCVACLAESFHNINKPYWIDSTFKCN